MTLQREYRNMRGDDNQHRKQRRPAHLNGGVPDHVHAPAVFTIIHLLVVKLLVLGQSPENVFNHDHRAVDDDAKIHRPQ